MKLDVFTRHANLTRAESNGNVRHRKENALAVLSHEGTFPIMYGTWPLPVGASHRSGYIARPDVAGQFPVVLVLPSLDGLGSFEKDLARTLARHGIAAVALDFYREEDNPLDAYAKLSDSRAITDIDEIHDFIASTDVDWNVSNDLGVLGLDVGGRFAIVAAATRPWVKSLVIASTPLTGDDERHHQVSTYLDHLPVPVLGLYGQDDELVDASTVDEAQRRNDHGQWLLYDGAGHNFFDIGAASYDSGAAADATARILAFFAATLPAAVEEDLG